MMPMPRNKIIEIVETAALNYPTVIRIGIFGSYARNEVSENSDVDFVYSYDYSTDESNHEFLCFVEDVLEKLKPLEADFVWERNLMKRNDDFKLNVLKDLIWIYQTQQSPLV